MQCLRWGLALMPGGVRLAPAGVFPAPARQQRQVGRGTAHGAAPFEFQHRIRGQRCRPGQRAGQIHQQAAAADQLREGACGEITRQRGARFGGHVEPAGVLGEAAQPIQGLRQGRALDVADAEYGDLVLACRVHHVVVKVGRIVRQAVGQEEQSPALGGVMAQKPHGFQDAAVQLRRFTPGVSSPSTLRMRSVPWRQRRVDLHLAGEAGEAVVLVGGSGIEQRQQVVPGGTPAPPAARRR